MTQEDIGATGGFSALSSADPASSYQAPAAPSSPRSSKAPQPTAQDVQAAVNQVNAHLATVNRVLGFRVDEQTGLTIATISNAQTGEVLQQSPGTDMIQLAQMLAGWSPGKNVLVDLMA